MMNADKIKKANAPDKDDQEAINRAIANARNYNQALKDEEEKKNIKTRLDGSSPSKPQKTIGISNFVGEIVIPAKIKFAMYDKGIQTGDENPLDVIEEDEAPFEPITNEDQQPFRNVSSN